MVRGFNGRAEGMNGRELEGFFCGSFRLRGCYGLLGMLKVLEKVSEVLLLSVTLKFGFENDLLVRIFDLDILLLIPL